MPPSKSKKKRPAARPQQRRAPQRPAPQRRTRAATAPRWKLPSWPAWIWAWLTLTLLFFILRAGGAITSVPLCFFLSAIAGAAAFSLEQLRTVGPAHPLLRFRQIVFVVVIVAIPVLYDPSTIEIDNVPRFVLVVVAATLILAAWAVDAVWSGWRPHRIVNGFQWVLLAIVMWFGVTTLTSVEPRQSLLGRYGSYEGFILLAALAVLASGLAESFTFDSLPALFRMVVASTVPVIVYGAIQIYGFTLHRKTPLDFVQWHNAYLNVFATLGNPNHLGGYFVILIPLGVVTAVLTRHRWARVAAWAWVSLMVLLLLQTAARGAWLGGLAAGAVLAAGMLPRIRASARTVGLAIGGGLVVAVVLIAGGSRFLGAKASALFQAGAGSSASQRYGYWSAAIRSGVHHPLVGTGPDTYSVTYTHFQDATLAKEIGSALFVNGAHNIFLSWLSNEGLPGLILIFALFAFGIAWGVRTWRSLRTSASEDHNEDAESRRYMVAALVAGFVGYFVQASFDVEQVVTLFSLFLVVGFLGIANRGVWPLATLRSPMSVFRGGLSDPEQPRAEEDAGYPIQTTRGGVYGRSTSQAVRDVRRLAAAVAVAVLGLAAVGLTYWRSDAMWRADHAAWTRTQTSVVQATKLNPWEPSYFATLGQAAVSYLKVPSARQPLQVAQLGVNYLGHAVALDGANSITQEQYGEVLDIEAGLEHSDKATLRKALAALELAKQENPYNTTAISLLNIVQKTLGSP